MDKRTLSATAISREIEAIAGMSDEDVHLALKRYGMESLTQVPDVLKALRFGRDRKTGPIECLHSIREWAENVLSPQPVKLRAAVLLLFVFLTGIVILKLLAPVSSIEPIAIPTPASVTLVHSNARWPVPRRPPASKETPTSIGSKRIHTPSLNNRDFVLARSPSGSAAYNPIIDCAYQLLSQRVTANQNTFFIYRDADSTLNHSFPSGLFGTIDLNNVVLDWSCIDDPPSTGCSADLNRLNTTRGTIFRSIYPALSSSDFAGLNWRELEHYIDQPSFSDRHDLTPATSLRLDARSPNIQFLPVPERQASTALSLPLGNQTFGAVIQQTVTSDQAKRNLVAIYEAAATTLTLLKRGQPDDVDDALKIADALSYALHHDNHAIPLPVAPDGSRGLHSAYQGGDIALIDRQMSGATGDVHLSGFSVKSGSCSPGGFCLVLNGTTGENNAWAMLALLAAYEQSNNVTYLNDAETIGKWIVGTLRDPATPATNPSSYGGYFVGFTDGGTYSLIKAKSTEKNGDIFVAFSLVAQVESARGNTAAAAQWQSWATVAEDFVWEMFDPTNGRFYVGTVPADSSSQPDPKRDNCEAPFIQKGNDIINTCDFLHLNSFTVMPMAASARSVCGRPFVDYGRLWDSSPTVSLPKERWKK